MPEDNEVLINRLEVIDHRDGVEIGRKLVVPPQKDPFIAEFSLQDDGKTLKIFMKDED